MKIDGVLHEFLAIPGVMEDVTDLILNLKEVRFKVTGDGNLRRLQIEKQGEGRITGKDIQTGAMVEVLNPDQHICTLARDAKLRMELTIKQGKGYVPAKKISRKTSLSERSPSALSFRRCAKSATP